MNAADADLTLDDDDGTAAVSFSAFEAWTHCIPFLSDEQSARIIERLKRHAVAGENGCILYRGTKNNGGYGRMSVRRFGRIAKYLVHRLSWWLAHGEEIPVYMEIAHKCDTPACFNPAHLAKKRRTYNRRDSAVNTNVKRALKVAAAREAA
ncbi:MAG: HNH endonuclease [Thermoleophilia bacterium]|nr:HNH endonuclease [Thermoleophilia bacterium]